MAPSHSSLNSHLSVGESIMAVLSRNCGFLMSGSMPLKKLNYTGLPGVVFMFEK